jgi:glycosyltransferase involved in cell wall biosynthesis
MKISVILPCYNGAKTIAIQMDALAHQTYAGEWELVVVNNGSTDNSMEIVEQYRDRIPHLRIVNAYTPPGPRLPVAHSYTTGIKAARADAFAFCEADDEVTSGWVAAMAAALTHYDLVTGPLQYTRLNEPWLIAAANSRNLFQSKGLEHAPGLNLPFAFGCNLGMKRSVYETLGGFNGNVFRFAWDVDFCWRAQLAGFELHFVPEIAVDYRLRHTAKAQYQQGYNWGKEGSLLYLSYSGKSLGWADFFFSLRLLVRCLPDGIKQLLLKLLNSRHGRGRFAFWSWMLGFQVGFIAGTFENIRSLRCTSSSATSLQQQPGRTLELSEKRQMPTNQEV